MSTSNPETSTGIVVRLARPGASSPRNSTCPKGATLADLLRASGTLTADQSVLIGGVPLEEAVALTDGVVVAVMPRPAVESEKEPCAVPIVAFDDEATWAEYIEIMKEVDDGIIPMRTPPSDHR